MIMLKEMKISEMVRIVLFTCKTCLPPPPSKFSRNLCHRGFQRSLNTTSSPIKHLHKTSLYKQLGISFVELLIMTLFLTGIAFSTAFLITRSKSSMKSTSQTSRCPMLAKEVLERFTTFGTRLYGYSYDGSLSHQDHHPKIRPLLMIPDTGASPPAIKDVAGHSRASTNPSQIKFPGIFQKTLADLSMTISAGSDGDWVNTGVDIIKMQNNQLELGSSVFIINTINVLQYLYNSDKDYFTGTRKKWHRGVGKKYGPLWIVIPL